MRIYIYICIYIYIYIHMFIYQPRGSETIIFRLNLFKQTMISNIKDCLNNSLI